MKDLTKGLETAIPLKLRNPILSRREMRIPIKISAG